MHGDLTRGRSALEKLQCGPLVHTADYLSRQEARWLPGLSPRVDVEAKALSAGPISSGT